MNFSERMKNIVDQGIKASKELAKQAGEKAQQWGEMGVLKLEIIQLRNQAEKMTARLGAEVYAVLVENGRLYSVSRNCRLPSSRRKKSSRRRAARKRT